MKNNEIAKQTAKPCISEDTILRIVSTIPFGLGMMAGMLFTVGVGYTGYKVASKVNEGLLKRNAKKDC